MVPVDLAARLDGDPVRVVVLGQVAHVLWNADYSETVFLGDGSKVKALAHHSPEQRATAHACGYYARDQDTPADAARIPVQRMCWEHEVVHTLLARARDLAVSPVLWVVAHNLHADPKPGQQEEWGREEAEVLALQRYLNTRDHNNDPGGILSALADEFDIRRWAAQAQAVLGRTRWQLLPFTSNSGKLLYTCTRCGRISPTPDKRCGHSNCKE